MNAVLSHHLRGVAKALVIVIAIAWIVFATIVVVLRHAVFPNIDAYRPDIERMASRALGETVHIAKIDASWRGLRPSLSLRDLQIVDPRGGVVLELPAVRATLSWESLLVMDLRLASLEVDAPQLSIRRDADGQLFVAGFAIRRKATPDNKVAEWLLAQDEIRVRKARIVWRDEMREPDAAASALPREDLVLSDVHFALVRSGWRHRAALRATPPSALAAPLDLRAVVDHSLFMHRLSDPTDWHGEVFANVGTGDVLAWRTWLPVPRTVDAGHGRARVWLRFTDASDLAGVFARRLAEQTRRPVPPALDRIAEITADLALDDVAVRWGASEYAALASIDGRVFASQTATEQRFSATHMALQPRNGITVPATDFHVQRTVGASLADEAGKASLGAIDIGVSLGLVPDPFIPPAVVEKYNALKPRGKLDSMSFQWTGPIVAPKTFQVDARFDRLALAAQPPTAEAIRIAAQPIVGPNGVARKRHPPFGQVGFENLSGTLRAIRPASSPAASSTASTASSTDSSSPDAATTRVSLNVRGADATITAPGLFDDPVLRLAHLEAQVGVLVRGSDVEVKVEHGALDNAEIAGTVEMTFRHGPNSGSPGEGGATGTPGRGWIDLDARLSRAEVDRVPRYLPNIIGEKARAYLVKSLLGGKVTEASFRMHGALERLDLRALPGAVATPYAVTIPDALIALRDPAGARKVAAEPPRTPASDEAIFHALIKVKGATFLYGPARDPDSAARLSSETGRPVLPSIAWPVFEDLDADIVFDQAHMTVLGHSTRVYGYRLTDVKAELPALADPLHVLRVTGRGNGPLRDLLRFINTSPISQWTKRFTETSQGSGDANLALALDLPLTHPRDAEVAGSLQLMNNDLVLNAAIPPLKALTGRLDFTDRGLAIESMTGRTLGGPLRVDARTGKDGYIELDADGTIDVAAFKASNREDEVAGAATPVQVAIDRATRFLAGSTGYHVGLRVRNKRIADLAAAASSSATGQPVAPDPVAKPDLVVTSDLVGLAIELPAPLAKPAAASWPLRIAITRTAGTSTTPDRENVHVSLSDIVDADVSRQRDPQGQLAVTRAGYDIGDDRSAGEGPSSVRISLPKLDLDAWRDVVKQVAATRPASDPAAARSGLDNLVPAQARLKTPLLHAVGRDFTNVAIDARRLASGWESDVVADQVAGRLSYTDVSGVASTRNGVAPASSGRLVARLSRLNIPQSDAVHVAAESALDVSKQKDFPAIDLIADRFELRGRELGRLEVVAENLGSGSDREWQLEKLGLTMPEARFAAHGLWGHASGAEHTRLDFDIDASDVGALMDRFGLTRTIKNGTARLTGNVAWNGGPSTIDFATMEGGMKLEADKGQFLKADPGIAKLLNILSLQGLARRLTLDFSDVFDAGFAFDTVRADATVERGIATTDDFKMRGVQATVSMSGSADLEHETTDLHVRVVPDINAGAASLGVAVINPVVGLATFAAQYLFKDEISRALSFEYNVVGPWKKPEVTRIDRNGKATPVVPRGTAASTQQPALPNIAP